MLSISVDKSFGLSANTREDHIDRFGLAWIVDMFPVAPVAVFSTGALCHRIGGKSSSTSSPLRRSIIDWSTVLNSAMR